MTFKIGVSIYSVQNRSIELLLEFAAINHFESVELWSTDLTEENESVLKALSANGRSLSVHGPLLNLGKSEALETNIMALRETVDLASKHNASILVLHTGIIDGTGPTEVAEGMKVAERALSATIDLAREKHVLVCLENEGYHENDLIKNFQQLLDLVKTFSSPSLGVVFDVSHANVAGGVKNGLETMGQTIRHLHVADNLGQVKGHHMPIGQGNIDFGLVKGPLHGKEITAILEIEPTTEWERNLIGGREILRRNWL
ncbi:MAG: sugar phosphate isomerase/epimerase family protein [Nitrososphaerales archaeon]|jgi:sugar phosphate isomerase/epimerase